MTDAEQHEMKKMAHNAAVEELLSVQNPDGSNHINDLAFLEWKALTLLSIILLNKSVIMAKGNKDMISSFAYTEAKNVGEFLEASLGMGVKNYKEGTCTQLTDKSIINEKEVLDGNVQ